jgi:hypothetical protein
MKLDWDTLLNNLSIKKFEEGGYMMSPSNAYAMSNSFSPYDLAMKPTSLPLSGLLPETAFNIKTPGGSGVDNATVIYPNEFLSLEDINGILEHERTHARQLPTKHQNQGYTTFSGSPGEYGIAEKSAMNSEDSYNLFQDLLSLK